MQYLIDGTFLFRKSNGIPAPPQEITSQNDREMVIKVKERHPSTEVSERRPTFEEELSVSEIDGFDTISEEDLSVYNLTSNFSDDSLWSDDAELDPLQEEEKPSLNAKEDIKTKISLSSRFNRDNIAKSRSHKQQQNEISRSFSAKKCSMKMNTKEQNVNLNGLKVPKKKTFPGKQYSWASGQTSTLADTDANSSLHGGNKKAAEKSNAKYMVKIGSEPIFQFMQQKHLKFSPDVNAKASLWKSGLSFVGNKVTDDANTFYDSVVTEDGSNFILIHKNGLQLFNLASQHKSKNIEDFNGSKDKIFVPIPFSRKKEVLPKICTSNFQNRNLLYITKGRKIHVYNLNKLQENFYTDEGYKRSKGRVHYGFLNSLKCSNKNEQLLTICSKSTYIKGTTHLTERHFLAAGGMGQVIYLWTSPTRSQNTPTGQRKHKANHADSLLHEFKGHQAAISSVTLSHDNKFIVSASLDNCIKVWSTKTYTEVASHEGLHKHHIFALVTTGPSVIDHLHRRKSLVKKEPLSSSEKPFILKETFCKDTSFDSEVNGRSNPDFRSNGYSSTDSRQKGYSTSENTIVEDYSKLKNHSMTTSKVNGKKEGWWTMAWKTACSTSHSSQNGTESTGEQNLRTLTSFHDQSSLDDQSDDLHQNLYISGDCVGVVNIFSFSTFNVLKTINTDCFDGIHTLHITFDNQSLITSGKSGKIQVWNLMDNEIMSTDKRQQASFPTYRNTENGNDDRLFINGSKEKKKKINDVIAQEYEEARSQLHDKFSINEMHVSQQTVDRDLNEIFDSKCSESEGQYYIPRCNYETDFDDASSLSFDDLLDSDTSAPGKQIDPRKFGQNKKTLANSFQRTIRRRHSRITKQRRLDGRNLLHPGIKRFLKSRFPRKRLQQLKDIESRSSNDIAREMPDKSSLTRLRPRFGDLIQTSFKFDGSDSVKTKHSTNNLREKIYYCKNFDQHNLTTLIPPPLENITSFLTNRCEGNFQNLFYHLPLLLYSTLSNGKMDIWDLNAFPISNFELEDSTDVNDYEYESSDTSRTVIDLNATVKKRSYEKETVGKSEIGQKRHHLRRKKNAILLRESEKTKTSLRKNRTSQRETQKIQENEAFFSSYQNMKVLLEHSTSKIGTKIARRWKSLLYCGNKVNLTDLDIFKFNLLEKRGVTENFDVSDNLWCPLTGVLMVDPVKTSGGQVYERQAIEKWFEYQRRMGDSLTFGDSFTPVLYTDPVTNIQLESCDLEPDFSARVGIQNFLRFHFLFEYRNFPVKGQKQVAIFDRPLLFPKLNKKDHLGLDSDVDTTFTYDSDSWDDIPQLDSEDDDSYLHKISEEDECKIDVKETIDSLYEENKNKFSMTSLKQDDQRLTHQYSSEAKAVLQDHNEDSSKDPNTWLTSSLLSWRNEDFEYPKSIIDHTDTPNLPEVALCKNKLEPSSSILDENNITLSSSHVFPLTDRSALEDTMQKLQSMFDCLRQKNEISAFDESMLDPQQMFGCLSHKNLISSTLPRQGEQFNTRSMIGDSIQVTKAKAMVKSPDNSGPHVKTLSNKSPDPLVLPIPLSLLPPPQIQSSVSEVPQGSFLEETPRTHILHSASFNPPYFNLEARESLGNQDSQGCLINSSMNFMIDCCAQKTRSQSNLDRIAPLRLSRSLSNQEVQRCTPRNLNFLSNEDAIKGRGLEYQSSDLSDTTSRTVIDQFGNINTDDVGFLREYSEGNAVDRCRERRGFVRNNSQLMLPEMSIYHGNSSRFLPFNSSNVSLLTTDKDQHEENSITPYRMVQGPPGFPPKMVPNPQFFMCPPEILFKLESNKGALDSIFYSRVLSYFSTPEGIKCPNCISLDFDRCEISKFLQAFVCDGCYENRKKKEIARNRKSSKDKKNPIYSNDTEKYLCLVCFKICGNVRDRYKHISSPEHQLALQRCYNLPCLSNYQGPSKIHSCRKYFVERKISKRSYCLVKFTESEREELKLRKFEWKHKKSVDLVYWSNGDDFNYFKLSSDENKFNHTADKRRHLRSIIFRSKMESNKRNE